MSKQSVIVLMAWLGAKTHNVNKYIELFNSLGFATAVFRAKKPRARRRQRTQTKRDAQLQVVDHDSTDGQGHFFPQHGVRADDAVADRQALFERVHRSPDFADQFFDGRVRVRAIVSPRNESHALVGIRSAHRACLLAFESQLHLSTNRQSRSVCFVFWFWFWCWFWFWFIDAISLQIVSESCRTSDRVANQSPDFRFAGGSRRHSGRAAPNSFGASLRSTTRARARARSTASRTPPASRRLCAPR